MNHDNQNPFLDSSIGAHVVNGWWIDPRKADFRDFPPSLAPAVQKLLKTFGITRLYSHQAEAFDNIISGQNVAVTTGVASGKSLCYQLPLLNEISKGSPFTALMLFPTKALTQDQLASLTGKITALREIDPTDPSFYAGIYDGDTPADKRRYFREQVNGIFTNPDMLHLGILPHHVNWADFFRRLRYVVMDEVHIYRGVFGSHMANVIRRLKRICKRYGSSPRFIITSATLNNVEEFVTRLTEEKFHVIRRDGSPSGKRHFILMNPPLVDRELGIRQSAMSETIRIAKWAQEKKIQTLIFAQSRRMVELILKDLQENTGAKDRVQGYRSGYLPEERRRIERRFREGKLHIVVATNALEMGIDIGGLDMVIMNGYPGSITSTLQQAGRAGRKQADSLAVLVASSNLLDQYILAHPEYLREKPPESALINPDNPYVLINHLQCAVFEQPFKRNEFYGSVPWEEVEEYLNLLRRHAKLHESQGQYFWVSDGYPANEISLRTAGASQYVLRWREETIGIVDEESAFWLVHPQAVYLHNGQIFTVSHLDQQKKIVTLHRKDPGYFTQAVRESEVELMEQYDEKISSVYHRYFGQLKVSNRTVGFKKIRWNTGELLGMGEVDLPPVTIVTHGCWFVLPEKTVDSLMKEDLWNNLPNDYGPRWETIRREIRRRDGFTCRVCGKPEEKGKAHHVHHKIPFKAFPSPKEANTPDNLVTLCPPCHMMAEKNVKIQSGLSGLGYLLGNLAPLFLMCDRHDLRVIPDPQSSLADGQPVVIFHDGVPGGIGLSEKLFSILPSLFRQALDIVTSCACLDGCPSCVGPVAENGMGARKMVAGILTRLSGESVKERDDE